MLHPDDEFPMKRLQEDLISLYPHGNVHVRIGLSIGLVFRCVTNIKPYNQETNKMTLGQKERQYLNATVAFSDKTVHCRRDIFNNVLVRFVKHQKDSFFFH